MDQDGKENTVSKKRARDELDEPGCGSPESKLTRVDSVSSDAASSDLDQNGDDSPSPAELGGGRVDSDNSGVRSPEVKRIQDDLLGVLDDSDEPLIQGLDSVIKSFEEEILVGAPVPEMTSDNGGSQPDLGYLLEASDDELGLPPTLPAVEEENPGTVDVVAEEGTGAVGYGGMLGFGEEIPGYDSFELGFNGEVDANSYNDNGDFVALGGLFDYSDEISGLHWQSESLPAL